jgi:cellulose synthase/poly-beta-1,6-N-acetylglucosamine synthase-like glycosyltransferase
MMVVYWLIGILYGLCLVLLGAWGVHRFVLLRWLSRTRVEPKRIDHGFPTVLVQIPLYNEPMVAARIIDAVAKLDWPSIEIQVLDDSTDETSAIVSSRSAYWAEQGILISHIRRDERIGYKAGALAAGLSQSHAEFVAIFDADFAPSSDFLEQMMPSLIDPAVGMVQACWTHLNRNQNWLTRVQALMLDGHFVIEHTARYRAGRFFNFNGTAGVWRRRCIIDAGGWSHDTVTEDLDLSYRAQLNGWKFVYRDDVRAPAELPGTTHALLTQQHRWAKGTAQTARKLVGPILSAPLPFGIQLEAVNHLLMVWAYPVVFLLSILFPPSIVARSHLHGEGFLFLDLFAVTATTISIGIFYATALQRSGESIRKRWWEIPAAMAVGIGYSASQTWAVFEGVLSDDATFERTPKRGNGSRPRMGPRIHLRRLFTHTVMALYYCAAIIWAGTAGYWTSLPFMFLIGAGYGAIAISQWIESLGTVEGAEMDVAPATK